MAVKDNISDLSIRQAMEVGAIGANGTTNGEIIDTADFDLGIGFAINVTNFTDGVFTFKKAGGVFEKLRPTHILHACHASIPDGKYLTLPVVRAILERDDDGPPRGCVCATLGS